MDTDPQDNRPLWMAPLQRATWRGLPFALTDTEPTDGRRVVEHAYPYRDDIWAEDLGRIARRIPITGFLMGNDVFAQRDAMMKVCAQPGPGTLVHPSMGSMQVVLLSSSFGEKTEDGRMVHLNFEFVVSIQPKYPGLAPDIGRNTVAIVGVAAKKGFLATVTDFVNKVYGFVDKAIAAVRRGFAVIGSIIGPILRVVGFALAAVSIARAAIGCVAGLGHSILGGGFSFGRFQGNLSGSNPALNGLNPRLSSPALTTAAIAASIARLTTNRTAVATAGAAVSAAVPALASNSEGFCQTIFALAELVRTTHIDPADQIEALIALCLYESGATVPGTSPINTGIAVVSIAVACVVRRAALTSLASACAAYLPSSSTETAMIIAKVSPLFDNEILTAADGGDMNTYDALRGIRTAVIDDLLSRGSALPALITVERTVSLPSLVLSQQLYQDAARDDDLVARAHPRNPLFMPRSFVALAA